MTHGIDRLAARAREYTPERVAAWTGMTAAQIEQLAREYATTRPAALRMNYGVQRSENGGTAARQRFRDRPQTPFRHQLKRPP